MTTDSPATGFRSLVEKIQEKNGDPVDRSRAPRRRLPMRRDAKPDAPGTSPAPLTGTALLRLLQRRWL